MIAFHTELEKVVVSQEKKRVVNMIESDRCSRFLTIVYENAINRIFTFPPFCLNVLSFLFVILKNNILIRSRGQW